MKSNYLKEANQNLGTEGACKATGVPKFSEMKMVVFIILYIIFNCSNRLFCNEIKFYRSLKEDAKND